MLTRYAWSAIAVLLFIGSLQAQSQTPAVGIDGYVRQGVGLVIREVFNDSLAQESGLLAGDTIVSANDTPINRADDFRAVLRQGGRIRLLVARNGRTLPMVLDLSNAAANVPNPAANAPLMPPAVNGTADRSLYPDSPNVPSVVTPPPGVLLPRPTNNGDGNTTVYPPLENTVPPVANNFPPVAAGAGPTISMMIPSQAIDGFIAALLPYTVTGTEPFSFDAPVVGRVDITVNWSATVNNARVTLTEQGALIDADVSLQAGPVRYNDRVRSELSLAIDPATRELVVTIQKAMVDLRFRENSPQTIALDLSRQLKPFRIPLRFLDQTLKVGTDQSVLIQANPRLAFTPGALIIESTVTFTPIAPHLRPTNDL